MLLCILIKTRIILSITTYEHDMCPHIGLDYIGFNIIKRDIIESSNIAD